jgi:hypothetical protein
MSKLRQRPSPALVISMIALFVALGSGAYAASKIDTSDIQKEAVTGPKIAKKAIKAGKVKDGGLKGKNLEDGTITEDNLGDEVVTNEKIKPATIGSERLAHPSYWAFAEGFPANLIRGHKAVQALRINPGNYRVEFEDDISACSYQATPADVNQNLTAAAELDVTNATRVFVSLRDGAAGTRTDGDYQVAVHC